MAIKAALTPYCAAYCEIEESCNSLYAHVWFTVCVQQTEQSFHVQ